MKSCPTCNRTFEDTLTYCLVDGSILSAPFDSHRTMRIPEVRKTEPSKTEVLPRAGVGNNAELAPTFPAAPLTYNPNVLPPRFQGSTPAPRRTTSKLGLWLKLILALLFAPVLSFGMGLVGGFLVINLIPRSPRTQENLNVAFAIIFLSTLVTLLILIFRWWKRKTRNT